MTKVDICEETQRFWEVCGCLTYVQNVRSTLTYWSKIVLFNPTIKISLQIPKVICYFTLTHIDNTKTTQIFVKTLVILKVSPFS
jgi:hypothetical protein